MGAAPRLRLFCRKSEQHSTARPTSPPSTPMPVLLGSATASALLGSRGAVAGPDLRRGPLFPR
eukprot:968393-Lingulodinium_polyedra.AAC.1